MRAPGPLEGMAHRSKVDERSGPGFGAKAASQRQLRVGEELRHALAGLLRPGQLRDPALANAIITVSEVRLSPDLRNATAFVMPLGGENAAEIIAGLRRSAPFLKGRIARMVTLRLVPNLRFALDEAFDTADRIAGLLGRPEVARDLGPRADDEDDKPG
ncbi:MAG TPA: 30S ribosome-binding factor RbfA [Stellaceae bacterium]|nr:30S ribosome-binding factor RbfA [Stellaceae bacterium]